MGPIFIVGNSRSGTTLMARVLSRHSLVHVSNETHYFQTDCAAFFYSQDKSSIASLLDRIEAIQFVGIYGDYNKASKNGYLKSAYENGKIDGSDKYTLYNDVLRELAIKEGKIFGGDQTPQNIFYIDEIINAYPAAKIINMVRDPRAVILSQRGKWKAALRLGQPLTEVVRSFFNYHPITMSLLWGRAVSAGVQGARKHGRNVIFEVKFENFVESPQEILDSLCEFIGIQFERDMLDVDLEMSSNESNKNNDGLDDIKGVKSHVKDKWITKLSKGEISLIQIFAKSSITQYEYPFIHGRLPLSIIPLVLYFPLHFILSIALNYKRIGDPIKYIKARWT